MGDDDSIDEFSRGVAARRTDNPAVLLVDDQPRNLDALAAALDGLDARVVQASSSDSALREALASDFAVVLLDVELGPGADGFETARLLRQRQRSAATPIIFVTARDADRETTLAAHEMGGVDVLYKPLDAAIVRAKVSVFLELHRLRDQSAVAAQIQHANERLRATVAELREARRTAEEARRAKDLFLATMSHEIRTPINAIIGYAQMIELGVAGPVSEQQAAYLARLDASSRHLLELVSDVLDLAKIDVKEMDLAREDEWTGPMIASAVEVVAPQAAARGVSLDAPANERGLAFVGDAKRVRQILVNLLTNAIKFTEPGGTITITCASDSHAATPSESNDGGPWTCISVTDTGIGVASHDQARIFDAFQQVETGHTRTRGGSGLGLAISRQLARLMGGDLVVKSAVGVGSTFTLRIPATRLNETAAERSARATPSSFSPGARGLCEIGEALRDEVHAAVTSYSARLRSDAAAPGATTLRQADLEDHAVTFLAEIAQALIIVDDWDVDTADLLNDSTSIQRAIAGCHGARRRHQGWSEPALARDFVILGEEVERVIRGRIGASSEDTEDALHVVRRLIDRAAQVSLRSWREAGGAPGAQGAYGHAR